MKIDTKLIHAGEPQPRYEGAVNVPIFQSAMYETGGEWADKGVRYIRYNNTPNHDVLHAKLAALENAEAALVTGSGMAAISGALLAHLSPGDRLLAHWSLYGGTHLFLTEELPRLGIEVDFFDAAAPETWEETMREGTRVVYVETITNPLMEVVALEEIAAFARRHGLVSLIDNTFATPLNFRPAEWGFDLSLHSATKYLNGHSDIVAGAVIGQAEAVDRVKRQLKHLGGTLDPHACFLLHRGLKTLAVRVRHQNASALALAQFLEEHESVAQVNYPGLPGAPDHARARHLLDGFGGMISFEARPGVAAPLLEALTMPIIAPSLGGVESLAIRPAFTSHAGLSAQERLKLGVTDDLVRLSIGLEDTDDLIADFARALDACLMEKQTMA